MVHIFKIVTHPVHSVETPLAMLPRRQQLRGKFSVFWVLVLLTLTLAYAVKPAEVAVSGERQNLVAGTPKVPIPPPSLYPSSISSLPEATTTFSSPHLSSSSNFIDTYLLPALSNIILVNHSKESGLINSRPSLTVETGKGLNKNHVDLVSERTTDTVDELENEMKGERKKRETTRKKMKNEPRHRRDVPQKVDMTSRVTQRVSQSLPPQYQRALMSLLSALSSEWRSCSLTMILDEAHTFVLEDFVLANNSESSLRTITHFLLPYAVNKSDENYLAEPITKNLARVGKSLCTNYGFLVEDSERLQAIMHNIHNSYLKLGVKFLVVTRLASYQEELQFSKTSPFNKIVNLLVATPTHLRGELVLHLFTHDFFLDNERISHRSLGLWPARSGALAVTPPEADGSRAPKDISPDSEFVFYPKKLENFHHYKLRVVTFNHPPVVIFENQEDGSIFYDGLEIRLLKTLASSLNFDFEIEQPRDGEKWGRQLSNGSWSGAMGETIRGEADVSFANYFITQDRLSLMDMTNPHYIDYTCFITPMPAPLPRYSAVVWPFQTSVWVGLFLTVLFLPPIMWFVSWREPIQWFHKIYNTSFYVYGILLNQSHPMQLLPTSGAPRLLFLTMNLSFLIVAVAYQSSLFSFLLVPIPAQPVNTLRQLLTSGLQWGVRDRGGWEKWFSDSIDPTAQEIAAGFEYVSGIDAGMQRVLEGDFAFMNSGTFLRYQVADKYTDEYGRQMLHIAKECFVPFRIGFGMPRFAVFTRRFNNVIRRVVEAGMVTRWFQDLVDKAEQKQRRKARGKSASYGDDDDGDTEEAMTTTSVLSLHHLQGPIYLLLIGYGLSLIIFFLELLAGSDLRLISSTENMTADQRD
ncbi:ionotropic receptor 21a-like isoform X2 [Oratosquilla oratoria]|uniref:ionotropic receptor 21a-like isoform X2 n=1 Tax=Oratosquilla oratoria TaxID=337810 RepID=UPI003F76D9F2